MAERLTGFDYCFTRCMKPGADKQEIREDCSLYKVCLERQIFEKLQHYEDLEEAGRLIIVPESFNVKTAVECITEKFCPSTFGLNNYTERCGHDDCKGCWEAALKGADHEA